MARARTHVGLRMSAAKRQAIVLMSAPTIPIGWVAGSPPYFTEKYFGPLEKVLADLLDDPSPGTTLTAPDGTVGIIGAPDSDGAEG